MATAKRRLGFGGLHQTAEFFGIPPSEVRGRAASGEWPSYVVGGRRVFDLDAIVDLLVHSTNSEPADAMPGEARP